MPATPVPALDWDHLSHRYRRQHWLERDAVRTAVALLDPRPDEPVLDLATGTGEVLRALARRPVPPRRVIGLDRAAQMLARVPPLPDGWLLRLGDARRIPLEDATIDAAAVAYLLHLLDARDLERVLGELVRVLSPGGRLVTVTPAFPPAGPARPIAAALNHLAHRWPDRYWGLAALDPSRALQDAGLQRLATRFSRRGYPSICVLAHKPSGAVRRVGSGTRCR
jgi:demethylmenaquinone methyltransferase/2-methoxy-6-polyprenyl-1,4-benzoquinol methylase